MVGLVRVMQVLNEIGHGVMVLKLGQFSGSVQLAAQVKMVPMKTGQIMNQINQEMKTVHNFMQMVQDGTIYHVILPV